MIKKICNWTFGSFFRTMGRFFFFLFFGFLIATILQKSNISITDLLGFETVKAITITQEVQFYGFTTVNQGTYESWMGSSWSRTNERYHWAFDPSESMQAKVFRVALDNKNLSGHDYMEIPLIVALPANYVHTETGYLIECSQWTYNGNVYYCNNWTSQQNNEPVEIQGVWDVMHFGANVILEDNTKSYCTVQNNNLVCPLYKKRVKEVWFELLYRSNNAGQLFFELDRNFQYYDIASPTSAIENQTQQQEQQHNETMSYFQSENTTQAETSASNFFSNFTDTDNGGISSIITAPLNAISGLLSATCTEINVPVPYLENQYIVLPCMSSIYEEHFGTFFHFYQLIIFGAVSYRMLVSIFLMIQGFKNPDNDRIEVVDL